MEVTEINRGVKKALDLFLDGDDPSIYTKPPQTAEDLIARGLIDASGAATEKGSLYLKLQDRGIFDANAKYTEKGWAYAMPYEKTLEPDNLWAFKVRSKDGVDWNDATFSDLVGGVAEYTWDAAAGLARNVKYAATPNFSAETEAKRQVAGTAMIEGALNASEELLALGMTGSAWVGQGLGDLIGMEKEADWNWWSAKQMSAKIQNENRTAKVGQTMEQYGIVANAAEAVGNAKATLPKEEFDAIAKQSAAFGSLLDPTILIPAGAAAKAGKVGVITRAGIQADRTLTKIAALDATIAKTAEELAAAQAMAVTGRNASTLATKMADDFTAKFGQTGAAEFGEKAAQARAIAERTAMQADEATRLTETLPSLMESLTATRQSLNLPENVAAATQRAIEIGNSVKTAPVRVVASVTETLGNGLVKLDDVLTSVSQRFGYDQAYKLLTSRVGQVGGFITGGPVGMGIAALRAGPDIQEFGKFSRIVGKELSQARGQVPFWQRVTNWPDLSPAHRFLSHTYDTATLGGAVPSAIRSAGRGALAAYPIDLTFQFLADGGELDQNTFKNAAAQSIVLGGSTGALGGIFQGSKAKHRELALGDELNFRKGMQGTDQKVIFDAMPQGARRAISTYAATNPQLQFRFTTQGQSSFADNVATINVASGNPLKPLIAHEVLHNIAIRNQMEAGISALLVGDGEAGGLLRSNDGTLDPNFKAFWDAYNSRLQRDGLPPVDVNKAALEYYIDSSADYVSSIAESGELGAISGRTSARRVIQSIVESTLPKIPIIRDIHFKLGGLMEPDGKMVMGNGLLADGIKELPEVRAMTRQMLRNSSGRAQGRFTPMGAKNDGEVVIPVKKGDKAILDKMVSLFETDEVNGQTRVKYDKNGDPVPIDKGTDAARGSISVLIGEVLDKQKAEGAPPPVKNEIVKTADGYEGTFLNDGVIKAIADSGIFNKEQVRMLKNINNAVKNFDGSRFSIIYQPALKTVWNAKRAKTEKIYASLSPTLRDSVPVAIQPTKGGNLIVGLMSVTQLKNNLQTRAESKRGKALYQGNEELIMTDISAVMELHHKDKETTAYFNEKYGATKGPEYKNFINSVFGIMTPSQREVNPVFAADNLKQKDSVYRTYRMDRINQATRMTGSDKIPMPFVYDSVRLNLMPNGEPTLDSAGNPVARPSYNQSYLNEKMGGIPEHTVEYGDGYGNIELSVYGKDDIQNPKVSALVSLKDDSINIETIEATPEGKGKGYGKALYLAIARMAQENFKDSITGSSSDEAIRARNSLFPTTTENDGYNTRSQSDVSGKLNYTPKSLIEGFNDDGDIIPLSQRFMNR